MTFRQSLQITIKGLQEIYDNAGGLRDVVDINDHKGKEAFNNIRRELPKLWGALQNLDNTMNNAQASYEVKGDYSIIVGVEHI